MAGNLCVSRTQVCTVFICDTSVCVNDSAIERFCTKCYEIILSFGKGKVSIWNTALKCTAYSYSLDTLQNPILNIISEQICHKSCTGGICLYGKHSRKIESSASSEMETEIILVCGNQAV